QQGGKRQLVTVRPDPACHTCVTGNTCRMGSTGSPCRGTPTCHARRAVPAALAIGAAGRTAARIIAGPDDVRILAGADPLQPVVHMQRVRSVPLDPFPRRLLGHTQPYPPAEHLLRPVREAWVPVRIAAADDDAVRRAGRVIPLVGSLYIPADKVD